MTGIEVFRLVWAITGGLTLWLIPIALVDSLSQRRGAGKWMAILTFFLPFLAPIFLIILLQKKPNLDAVRKRLEHSKQTFAGGLIRDRAQPAAVTQEQVVKAAALAPFWTGLVAGLVWPALWMVVFLMTQSG